MSSMKTAVITSAIWVVFGAVFMYLRETTTIQVIISTKANQNSLVRTALDNLGSTVNNVTKEKEDFIHNQNHWVYKLSFMERPEEVPQDKRICFVHVGKTAGSTLACYLGFHYDHCATGYNDTNSLHIPSTRDIARATDILKEMIPAGSYLPHYTTSSIHKSDDSCTEDHAHNMYLFVVRNPFARIQSWFEYERVDEENTDRSSKTYSINKPLYIDCEFQTLNQLGGSTGLGASEETTCSTRAWKAITGAIGYRSHNMYNYGNYYNKVLRQIGYNNVPLQIIVIRNEHLVYDWNSIEMNVLNSTTPPLADDFTFPHKNKSPKRIDDMHIDDTSKRNICHALCEEIQVYKKILQQAMNLNKADYAQSMHELAADCPVEVLIESC